MTVSLKEKREEALRREDPEGKTTWKWRQRSEWGIHKPRNGYGLPKITRGWERGTKPIQPRGPWNQPRRTIWLEDFVLQNCKRINFYCLKLQSLWKFVRAARKGIHWSIKFDLPILHYFLYGVHKPRGLDGKKEFFFPSAHQLLELKCWAVFTVLGLQLTAKIHTDTQNNYFHSLNLRGSII